MCQTISLWRLLYMVNAFMHCPKGFMCLQCIAASSLWNISSADVKKHSQLQSSIQACLEWQSLQNQIHTAVGVLQDAVPDLTPTSLRNSDLGGKSWLCLWGLGWEVRICLSGGCGLSVTLIVIPLALAALCFNRSSATSRTISLTSKKPALHAAAVDSSISWEAVLLQLFKKQKSFLVLVVCQRGLTIQLAESEFQDLCWMFCFVWEEK